jgi:UPF0755 protein
MRIQVGEYRITPGLSVMALLDNMQHGRVWVHQVRFIEGWTWRQCAEALVSSPALVQKLPRLGEKALQSLLHDTHPNLEGLLAPNTYFYAWPSRDVNVVRRAYLRRQKALALAWSRRAPALWYRRPYQALIVASLIERETALASERADIAAVILNRLKKRMRLQVDPTVNYGLALPYGQALTRVNLRTKNPYNTYTRYGLPPTPIAMPSQASIVAALHPAQTDALYYVARKDGSHVFTRSYMDHLRAKQRFYLLSSVERRYYDAHQH